MNPGPSPGSGSPRPDATADGVRPRGAQSVFRAGAYDREHPFTRVLNSAVQDERLSFRARGVLVFVLSKPDHWSHSAEKLAANSSSRSVREGAKAIKAALDELVGLGYCQRIRSQDATGQFHTRLVWHEVPTAPKGQSATDNPKREVGAADDAPPTQDSASRPTQNRQSVDRESVARQSVDGLSLERPTSNDCIETNVVETNVGEGESSGAPILLLEAPVAYATPHWSPESGWQGITAGHRERWKIAYPACDIDLQFAQMDDWLRANPAEARKSKWLRFIAGWLKREQDKGGDSRASRRVGARQRSTSMEEGNGLALVSTTSQSVVTPLEQSRSLALAPLPVQTAIEDALRQFTTFPAFRDPARCKAFLTGLETSLVTIAKNRGLTIEGTSEAFSEYIRDKSRFFVADGTTPYNVHQHFESWLRSNRAGNHARYAAQNHSNGGMWGEEAAAASTDARLVWNWESFRPPADWSAIASDYEKEGGDPETLRRAIVNALNDGVPAADLRRAIGSRSLRRVTSLLRQRLPAK